MEENREAFSGADNALPEESDKEKTKKTVRKRKPVKTEDTAPEKIRRSERAQKLKRQIKSPLQKRVFRMKQKAFRL